jgi:hypothetical protein
VTLKGSLILMMLAVLAAASSAEEQAGTPAPRIWGDAYYQFAAGDTMNAGDSWTGSQESGVSLNVRTPLGLEVVGNFVVPLELDTAPSPDALIAQLFVKASPAEGMSVSAGRQRLNWGTAKVFSPIDILEARADPLDVRPFLPGVSGVKLDIFPNDRLGVSLVALPASELRWSRAAARVEYVMEDAGLDLGLGVVKYGDPDRSDRIGLLADSAWSVGPVVFYEESELRWGRESSYLFPGMGAVEDLDGKNDAVVRAAGGALVQVDLGLTRPATLLVEYFFNGDGFSSHEARTFASRYDEWQAAGSPAGAQVPGSLAALGGFRRHYASVALADVAVARPLLLGVSGILGIESLLGRLAVDLEWELRQGTSLAVRYEVAHALRASAHEPSELLLIPFRNRITFSISTSLE